MSKQKKAGILSLGAGKCLSYALTLMLTLAAFLLPSSAMADVAWVEYDDDNSTLTFKYGAEKPSDGTVTVYDLNEGTSIPEWNDNTYTTVVFDKSFSSARPTTCRSWFDSQSSLTSIKGLEYLNTEKVTDMRFMFFYCSALESLDLSTFNTKNVTDMTAMFECCSALKELDLSSFNTASVTSMQAMFMGNYELTTIYASDKFDVTNVMNSNDMFNSCTSLAGATKYTDDNTDAKMANYDGYFSKKEAWAEYDSDKSTLTFKYGKKPSSEGNVTVYDLNKDYDTPGWYGKTCTSVVFDKSFSNARPTSCYYWFGGLNSLTSIEGLEYLNTEEVTLMHYMFSGCSSLESLVLSTFNTANVTNMTGMFSYCTNLKELDLSNFNTTNVTDMNIMFSGCTALNKLDLSSFNTQRVTNTMYMFQDCTNLNTIYVSDKFDVTNVVISDDMFKNCTSLVGAVGYNASNTNDYTMANYKTGYFKTYYKVGETKTELCGETLSVDNLTLEGDKDLVVNAPFTATSVSYSRPMTSKWGTLCVPFEVDASSATGTKFYKLESVNYEMITLTKLEGKIAAGTPMLVNSTDGDGNAANISISAESVKVGAAPADGDQAGGWQLVGSFAETEVPDDGYIISKNKFWLVSDLKEKVSGTKSVKTKAMRAWLKPSAESAEAKAHVLSIALDDENETTAVDAIEALTEDTAEIYDLQGRRLDSLQKGLNIVKTGNVTRKVMVK